MRYLVGFFITIGLIILLIVLLVGGGGKDNKVSTSKPLSEYVTSGIDAMLTIDGPVNANSQHDKIRITVNSNNVIYEEIRGYDNEVTEMHTYENTIESFDAFMHSLQHAGFSLGNKSKELADEKGFCPLDRRYVFELKQGEQSLQRFWATSCGKPKTFNGDLATNLELFQSQVPNYSELTDGLGL